jgi:hypothetical protein
MQTTGVDLRPIVAANVRARRAWLGIRQEEAAIRVGLPRSTWRDVESGRRRLYFGEVVAVVEGLGITLDELLTGADPRTRKAFGLLDRT